MEIISHIPHLHPPEDGNHIALTASRETLAKRRWRGVAADGREFGFDLDHELEHGHVFFSDGGNYYIVLQEPEPVLEVAFTGDTAKDALLAWQIGNLHFPVEITTTLIRITDDPAIEAMLAREGYGYSRTSSVFRPAHAARHGHHHH